MSIRTNLDDYLEAFSAPAEPFLTWYCFSEGGAVSTSTWSRGEFLDLARRAAGMLADSGCLPGRRFLLCCGRNHPADLACRLAATLTGAVPVTVNWQADTPEQALYKFISTEPAMVLADETTPAPILDALRRHAPAVPVRTPQDLFAWQPRDPHLDARETDAEHTRIIIFTSGTTGRPKGVELPYRAYRTNRGTFEKLLLVQPGTQLEAAIVNPLHHTNSTAITDWLLRRPRSHIHLLERYSTPYWRILAGLAGNGTRVVAPTVSRHFDFLADLDAAGRLPLPLDELRAAFAKVDFLIGSAPVGPTTIGRLRQYAGRVPTVRFGSTETCLQVIGIPGDLDDAARLACFEAGWRHRHNGEDVCGYYIGRPTHAYTEARIVAGITPGQPGYMEDRPAGTPGYLVTRGGNLMRAYVGAPEATAAVFADGWYTGLRDIAFRLQNPADGGWDYYWLSRDSALLIRGGSNYAYEQVEAELAKFICTEYGLDRAAFELAVVGLRLKSEHEDECCVTIEWRDPAAAAGAQEAMARDFLAAARRSVSKGARPDHLLFARIPRNFKGAVLVPELRAAAAAALAKP